MRCIFFNRHERCEVECSGEFICAFHRKHEEREALEKMWAIIRDIVLKIADTGRGRLCYHCGKVFDREYICIDHFPDAKRSIRSDEMWFLKNYVPSCQRCNTSGSRERSESLRETKPWQKAFIETRDALFTGIEELSDTRDGMKAHGVILPPIHEHIDILAMALSPLSLPIPDVCIKENS